MKKKTRNIIIISSIVLLATIAIVVSYFLFNETRLTTEEKRWISNNTSTIINIDVLNNVDILGKNGKGIIYDFIDSLKKEHNLSINPITYNIGENHSFGNRAFKIKSEISENDLVFAEEHYVVIAKKFINIKNLSDLKGQTIAVLANDENRLKNYSDNFSVRSFEDINSLLVGLTESEEINYFILPLNQYYNNILKMEYSIVYHLSDLSNYYVYEMPREKDIFSNILTKFYKKYQKENLDKSIKQNTLLTLTDSLSISQKELTEMQSKVYEYGFINNSPYEVIIGGNYGGIISEYLRSFSDISNIEFKFHKYNSVTDFERAIANNSLNLYFDYYNLSNEYQEIPTTMDLDFNIIAPINSKENPIKSLKSLSGKTIYVLSNSKLKSYLDTINNIEIKTYDNESDLNKIAKKGNLIAIDSSSFDYYKTNILSNYSSRFYSQTSINYNFKTNANSSFIKLFNKYISTLDSEKIITIGLYNHQKTIEKGNSLTNIAKYSLLIVGIICAIIVIIYRSSKKVRIATKIKKEDKIRFIDQLTSLKNRNYLSENINNWNKNTIYPQATIIVDLNNLQEINDTMGYEYGDNQIKAAANILIKTQLDNSDIIRTDGNEFLIYLVGYQEKQVISYIRKLYKEFKNLPYEHGAAIGYSMINDDIKTLEDAINEAVEDMRTKKEEILEA